MPLQLLLFLSLSVRAADNRDSLISKIDSLLLLSQECKVKVDNESAIEFAYEALAQSSSINYSEGKARAYLSLGQTLFYLGSYEKSLQYLSFTEKEPFAHTEPLMMFEICRIRGQIFFLLKLTNQSIREFSKCISLASKIRDRQNCQYCLSLTYENFAVVYDYLEMSDSLSYFLEKNRNLLLSMDEAFVYRNLVNLYTTVGNIHLEKSEFDQAESCFSDALMLAEKYQYPYISRTKTSLGDMEMIKGNLESALQYYYSAMNNLGMTKLKGEYPAIYKRISDIYEQIGIFDSLRYYRDMAVLVEKELGEERENSVEHALEVFINEERSLQSKTRWLTIGKLSAVAVLLLFGIYFFGRIRRKRLVRESERESERLKTSLDSFIRSYEEIEMEARQLEKRLSSAMDDIVNLAKKNDPHFLIKLRELYPEAAERFLERHPDLTNSDLTLCGMIFLNFSTKDIATYTFLEHRSVQTKRGRLRKKLNLPAGSSIEQYLRLQN